MKALFKHLRRISTAVSVLSVFACYPILGAETVYFLVAEAEGPQKESFLLPLKRTEDIAHARSILAARAAGTQVSGSIVVATIKAGADGLNRNYLAPGAPLWGWHVTDELAFADRSTASVDGSPSIVDSNPEAWIRDHDGLIGFWKYTVVTEVSIPLAASVRPTPEGAELSWMNLGTNFVYTVESASLEKPAEWFPAAGQAWPIPGTNWVDKATSPESHRLYRVRAEETAKSR